MTGEDRFLEAAETGTEYLREHLRTVDTSEGIAYWYHAIDDRRAGSEKKILASEFGDDYEAIPAYEQIYALAGPTQTVPHHRRPADQGRHRATIALFERYFLRPASTAATSRTSTRSRSTASSDALGRNRARKNWNSVGDHVPAYLINAWLATGDDRYADMLESTADTIDEALPRLRQQPVRPGAVPRGLEPRP